MKNLLLISTLNPLKLILLLIEIIYFIISLLFAPQNHYYHLTSRFSVSFITCFISDFSFLRSPPASPRRQNLLGGLKVLALIGQIHYFEEIDWFNLSFVDKEALLLDLAFEGLLRLFILNLLSAVYLVKFIHFLASAHIFYVLMIYVESYQNLITRVVIQALLFCLLLCMPDNIMKKKEENMEKGFCRLTKEEVFRNVLDNLEEGVILLDKQGEVRYVSNYLENSGDELTLEKLSNQFSNFELNDFIPANLVKCPSGNQIRKFDLSASFSNLPLRFEKDCCSHFDSSGVASLIDVFNFYMKPASSSEFADSWKFRPTFKAKFHPVLGRDSRDVELDVRVIETGLDDEDKQLLILIKNTAQSDLKNLLIEKEKTIYQENFVCSLSHELRTPLNANLAFLEQAMDSSLVHPDVKENLLKPAFVSAKLLFYIVSDVLDYSVILANTLKLDIKSKSIIRTVNKCLEIFYAKAIEKKIRLNLVIQGEIPTEFRTDHKRVSQVLINLLKNAVQFTIKGTIEVVLTGSGNQNLVISVRDTGIGMSQSAQDKLNSNLKTGQLRDKIHDNSVGIGFGIFISNKLAKQLSPSSDGVKFHSELGIGSQFSFEVKNSPFLLSAERVSPTAYLQQKDQIAEAYHEGFDLNSSVFRYTTRCLKNRFHSAPSPALPQKTIFQPKSRVLIVDDEVFNIIVIENFCKSIGIAVEKALNGEEALAKLKACSVDGQTPLKAIFMDINMPVKDGYQATKEIQQMIENKEIKRLPVIGVTAYGSKEKIEKAYNSGMVEVLIKPLSKEVIMEVLSYYKVL